MTVNEWFIPVPRVKNTQISITINGTEMKNYVYNSEFILVVNRMATFRITLANAGSRFTGDFVKGHDVKFFADNTNGTRLQFWGRIDFVKGVLSSGGEFLEIEGRHRSWKLTEIKVNYSASNADPANILKAIIDLYAPGFTYANVSLTGKSHSVDWKYAPFMSCLKELATAGEADAYVDDDLDFHFFTRNSIFNKNEFIAQNDNHIRTVGWGTDDLFEKTRVIVTGQDNKGLPIIYTAKNGVDNALSETDVREVHIQNDGVNSFEKAQDAARSLLNTELTNIPPRGTMLSWGLQNALPGDNFWVVVPRQEIYGVYRAIRIKHMFGTQVRGWRTETVFEREEDNLRQVLEKLFSNTARLVSASNPNNHGFSFNFEFDNDNQTASHSNTQIAAGALRIAGSNLQGTWTSITRIAPADIMKVELDYSGKDLGSSIFSFSVDGINYEAFTGRRILQVPISQGLSLKVKVNLVKDSNTDPAPQLDSLVVLYTA